MRWDAACYTYLPISLFGQSNPFTTSCERVERSRSAEEKWLKRWEKGGKMKQFTKSGSKEMKHPDPVPKATVEDLDEETAFEEGPAAAETKTGLVSTTGEKAIARAVNIAEKKPAALFPIDLTATLKLPFCGVHGKAKSWKMEAASPWPRSHQILVVARFLARWITMVWQHGDSAGAAGHGKTSI
eukprot:Gb_11484 [translate_table: standard]